MVVRTCNNLGMFNLNILQMYLKMKMARALNLNGACVLKIEWHRECGERR